MVATSAIFRDLPRWHKRVGSTDGGVVTGGGHGGHVQHRAHGGGPSPDAGRAPVPPTNPILGNHTDQRGNLALVEVFQFRQFGPGLPGGVVLQSVVEFPVQSAVAGGGTV